MRILLALAFLPLPAFAQDAAPEPPLSRDAFMQTMQATAQEAGPARLPVACGGLFRALRLIAGDGTEMRERFDEQERDMGMVAVVMHKEEFGGETDAAVEAVFPHIKSVSTLYLVRFKRNRDASGGLLDDVIRENYDYCEGLHGRLMAAWDE